jgi:hypothetical protein
VVSAYENGHREPSLPTLRHLVEATGQQLSIEIRSDRAPVGLPDTPRGHLLRRRRAEIHRIADRYGVSSLRVFGSVADLERLRDIFAAVDAVRPISNAARRVLDQQLSGPSRSL